MPQYSWKAILNEEVAIALGTVSQKHGKDVSKVGVDMSTTVQKKMRS